jgi:hypothetical protein
VSALQPTGPRNVPRSPRLRVRLFSTRPRNVRRSLRTQRTCEAALNSTLNRHHDKLQSNIKVYSDIFTEDVRVSALQPTGPRNVPRSPRLRVRLFSTRPRNVPRSLRTRRTCEVALYSTLNDTMINFDQTSRFTRTLSQRTNV